MSSVTWARVPFSGLVLSCIKHFFTSLGHGVTILTAGGPGCRFMATDTVEMIGTFESWFIDMIKVRILQGSEIGFIKPVCFVAADAGDLFSFATIAVTAGTIWINDLSSGGMVMAFLTTCIFYMHGMIEFDSGIEIDQAVNSH